MDGDKIMLTMANLRGRLSALQEAQETLRLREHQIRTELQHLQNRLDSAVGVDK